MEERYGYRKGGSLKRLHRRLEVFHIPLESKARKENMGKKKKDNLKYTKAERIVSYP